MAAGITQPGGAGTTIMIYDDTDTSGGRPAGSYTFAQISAAFPADFVDVTVAAARPKYKSLVDLQLGDGGAGRNVTTLQATKSDLDFAATHGLKNGSGFVQPCPWRLQFGTRIDTLDGKVGWKDGCNVTVARTMNDVFLYECYDTVFRQVGTGVLNLTGADNTADIQRIAGCHLQNINTGAQPSQLGATGGSLDQFLDSILSYDTTSFCINNASFDQCERITVTAATPTAFIRSGGSGVAMKDFRVIGSPTTSDYIWTGAAASGWTFIRPVYSQSGCNKFSIVAGDLPLNGATTEYWLFDTTIVDRNGNAVAGIPVTLTDAIGNVVVNTVTGAGGNLTFNILDFGNIVCTTNGTTTVTSAGLFGPLPSLGGISGTGVPTNLTPAAYTKVDNSTVTLFNAATDSSTQARHFFSSGYLVSGNAVPVIDHYTVGSVYTQRHRSPFTYAINTGAAANPAYLPRRGTFYWPGYPTVTKNAGTFEDVAMVINIQDPSGGPTTWQELTMP